MINLIKVFVFTKINYLPFFFLEILLQLILMFSNVYFINP